MLPGCCTTAHGAATLLGSPIHPSACGCAAPGIFTYRSQGRRNSYILNTNPTSFKSAQTFCNTQGGHLASWDSYAEQYEVEQYFVGQVRVLASCRPAECVLPARGLLQVHARWKQQP